MSEWDDLAATWDQEEGAQPYSQRAFDEIQKRIELNGETVVLDFGSGTGMLTGKLLEVVKTVVAVDTSGPMIEKLKEKFTHVETHAADIRQLIPSLVIIYKSSF